MSARPINDAKLDAQRRAEPIAPSHRDRMTDYEVRRARRLPEIAKTTALKLLLLEREAGRLGVRFPAEEIEEMRRSARMGDKIAALRLKERL